MRNPRKKSAPVRVRRMKRDSYQKRGAVMKTAYKLVSILAVAVLVFAVLGVVAAPLPAPAQTIQVLSAYPASAAQGTINLNVSIKGKGFKNGAQAKFYVTGTNLPGGIVVHSTTFKGATEVVANIDVADNAEISKFDIEVMSDGRTGKGTEMFSVTSKTKTDPCAAIDPVPTGGYCFSGAPGMPGCLDSSFGGGTGRVMLPPGLTITGLATQNIGTEERVIAVGYTDYFGTIACLETEGTLVRYNSDGSFDQTFGSGGILKSAFLAEAVAMLPGNKLLVAGRAPVQIAGRGGKTQTVLVLAVARYNEDGSLDATFGNGGIVTVLNGTAAGRAYGLALQSDGKIVLAGYFWPGYMQDSLAVVRLNPNGSLDSTFNGTGKYIYPGPRSVGSDVAIQPVGPAGNSEERIVIAGQMINSQGALKATLWRLTPDGQLDTSFAGSGVIQVPNGTLYAALAVDSSNRVIAVGEVGGMGMARYDQSGNLDPSFGTGGVVTAAPGNGSAEGIVIRPDGYILVVGPAHLENDTQSLTVWRFSPDGAPDTNFGNGGWVSDSFTIGGHSYGWTLLQQSDGKILAGGDCGTSGVKFAALARFWQ